ncbi:unnamed protein product [Meganyctiphanes norvegica]|uniref:Uncharacterized protein n=1 Tax=Meganyctiphanes norvegica TaxID=48144 RepID=A0AAV2QM55_MEGNR
MQNKIIRFMLNLDNRSHIGNKELAKTGFLKVPGRVKQLKLGHVIKIKNNTSPYYLSANFQNLNESKDRIVTRSKVSNFYKPRVCTNTFVYSAINDWNNLSSKIKEIKNENTFKDKLRKYLFSEAEKDYSNPFIYY